MAPPAPNDSGSVPLCPICPICEGKMELVYERFNQQVCVCVECHTGLTIPSTAQQIRRIKRGGNPKPEP
jgi:predicted DsbA family dithiol-disulfide isomerase